MHDFISNALDKPQNAAVIVLSFDFSKAFDCVSQCNLLRKFSLKSDFPRSLLSWLSNYLLGRQQRIRLNEVVSSLKDVSSGVPQGSILGPILFSLYTSDFKFTSFNSITLKHADDTVVICPITNDCTDVNVIRGNVFEYVKDYSENNSLKLKISKTKILPICKRKVNLHVTSSEFDSLFVTELVYLGIVFNTYFSWDTVVVLIGAANHVAARACIWYKTLMRE